jgi:membrane fusion protein, multidrug efflux system
MSYFSHQTFRRLIFALLTLIILWIIFAPKLKPILKAKFSQENVNTMRPQGMGGGAKSLYARGYQINPTRMHELIYSTGSLLPDEEVDLAFEISGKITGLFFEEGSRVKKGDLLAKLNDDQLQAQLMKLKAQIKLSREREFRQRQLLEKGAASQENYDQAATELLVLEADIKLLEARIAQSELRAPFDGIVGLRMISEGAIAGSQTNIVRLVKTNPLKVVFSIPERYAGEVRPGFPIEFTVDGLPQTFRAKVYAIDPKVDMLTRTIQVKALYPNDNEELKPGRFAQVTAILSQIDRAIAIPSEAVIPEMAGEKVFVYKNGQAEERRIEIGLRTESLVQVRSGLEFGDTLLTTAIL